MSTWALHTASCPSLKHLFQRETTNEQVFCSDQMPRLYTWEYSLETKWSLVPQPFLTVSENQRLYGKRTGRAVRSEFKTKLVNIGEKILFLKYFSPPKSTSEVLAKSGGLLKGNLR